MLSVKEEVGRICSCLGDGEVLTWEIEDINASVNKLSGRVRVAVTHDAQERLTLKELETVLAHECDNLDAGLFHRLIVSVYFAVPVV